MHKVNGNVFRASGLGLCLAVSGAVAFGADTNEPPAKADAELKAAAKPKWEKSLAIGLSLTRGNSDTVLFNASALAQRKWTQNELSLGIDGSYGENNKVKSAESVHGFSQYNRLFTERLYGFGRVDGLHDAVADIEYRFIFSPGLGNYFIKNDRMSLSAEVGPGVVVERLGNTESTYLTLRVGERFEYKLSDRARLWQSLEYLPQVDRFSNYLVNAEVGIEADLTKDKKLSLRTFLQDSYRHEPAPGRKQNDMKLVSAIAYKF